MKNKRTAGCKNSQFNIHQYDHCLSDSDVETQCRAVSKYPSVINLIEWPSLAAIKMANTQCPGVFRSKVTPTDDQLVELMIETPMLIQHLKKASPRAIDSAVIAFNGLCYDPAIKVTAEMITHAVSQCGMLLGLIRDRTEERCYLAICNDIEAIQWIDNPSERIVEVVSKEIRGLIYMFGRNRSWTPLTENLIATAKERLCNYSIARDYCDGHYFRKALFSVIDKKDALFYLDFDWMYDSIRCEDFVEEPCDEIKKILLTKAYRSIEKYQKYAPKSWSFSEKLQLFVANYPYEIQVLRNPCLKARVAGIETLAGVPHSGSTAFDDEICKAALSRAHNKPFLKRTLKLIKSPSESVRQHYEGILKVGFPVAMKPSSIPSETSKAELTINPPPCKAKRSKQVEIEEIPF